MMLIRFSGMNNQAVGEVEKTVVWFEP